MNMLTPIIQQRKAPAPLAEKEVYFLKLPPFIERFPNRRHVCYPKIEHRSLPTILTEIEDLMTDIRRLKNYHPDIFGLTLEEQMNVAAEKEKLLKERLEEKMRHPDWIEANPDYYDW